nr:uncharacterized protein LOC112986821 isoform X2 [Dromaius novaehollandiae]
MEPEDEQEVETTQTAGNMELINAILIQRHPNALQALGQQLLHSLREPRTPEPRRRCCKNWICLSTAKATMKNFLLNSAPVSGSVTERNVFSSPKRRKTGHLVRPSVLRMDLCLLFLKTSKKWFQIQNHSECAYLESFTISTSACSLPRTSGLASIKAE